MSQRYPFSLQALPWSKDSLSSFLREQNITVHYDLFQKSYVDRLNALAVKYPVLQTLDLGEIVQQCIGDASNFAAQILNHDFFWQSISPHGGPPSDRVHRMIVENYGSIEKFQQEFNEQAMRAFGSAWIWAVYDPMTERIRVILGEDAYNPIKDGYIPLFCLDLWEHSYYLDYLNDRQNYLDRFWRVLNWSNVEALADKFIFKFQIRGPI